MRTHLFLFLLLCMLQFAQGQTTVSGSFDFDGDTRTYSFYVPASYVQGEAVPLVLNLHGTSSDGAAQAQNRDFRPIADTANFIVVHPDGTELFGQRFWNYGNVFGSTVDDVGFLEALIDTISASYSIDHNRVYSAGMSNGSFMCYYLACQTDRFAAIGAVTGSMGNDMYDNCTPSHPTPIIHVHGTDDPINTYTGTSTSKAIEEVIRFWVNNNDCDTVPTVTDLPDIDTDDDATAERFLYADGINAHTVELFKVTGGGHTWPGHYVFSLTAGSTCMDFDASIELWRFFSQYTLATASSISPSRTIELNIYPNPTIGKLFIQAENRNVTSITITDMQGRMVVSKKGQNLISVDLSALSEGTYFAEIAGKDFSVVSKAVLR